MLTRFLTLIAPLLLAPALSLHAQSWQLVWADEFDVDGLPDPTKWSYDVGGGGWGNQEEQYYTEADLDNARVEDGVLVIEARRETVGTNDYTSARLVSREQGDWRYGRIEARAQFPSGLGTWSAIWMLPTDWVYGGWPQSGEIDIVEHVGYENDVIHGTIHTEAYNHSIGTQRGGSVTLPSATTDFHVYAVEWTPQQITFLLDDEPYYVFENEGTGSAAWPFDQRFHLLLNMAVGGTWGGAEGIDEGAFPEQMLVDYVRVYAYTATPEVELTAPDAPVDAAPGDTLSLNVSASDSDGSIAEVAFFQGDGRLGTATAPPYALTLNGLAEGCYAVHAVATDDLGYSTATDTVAVTVGAACGQAPYLMVPAALPGTLEAEHYDLGGSGVAYSDLNPNNTGNGPRPDEGVDTGRNGVDAYVTNFARREWLAYTVDVKQAGTYTLEARVSSALTGGTFTLELDGAPLTDPIDVPVTGSDDGWALVQVEDLQLTAGPQTLELSIQSGGFNLDRLTFTYIYTDVPEATLVTPAEEVTLEPGASLRLEATASDPDGSIAEVAFFQGDGRLGTATAPPYALTLNGLAEGCYAVHAVATDDLGYSTATDTVAVTVGAACGQAPYLMVPAALPGTLEAEHYDLGGSGAGYSDLDPNNTGDGPRTDEGVDLFAGAESAYVGNLATREWLAYTVQAEQADTYTLTARVASATNGGAFALEADGTDLTGTVSFDGTGGDETWTDVAVSGIELPAGTQTLRFTVRSGGFTLDRLRLTSDTGVATEATPELPGTAQLRAAYPNPFNPSTVLSFDLPRATDVRLEVFDVLGRRVARLADGPFAAGTHTLRFDAGGLSGGTYLVRLTTPDTALTRPLTLLK